MSDASFTQSQERSKMTMTTTQQTDALQVWIADDDADDHLLFSLAVAEVDLEPDLTFLLNGNEMLDMLSATPLEHLPDLVILDLRMPGLGGHRTLELMRDNVKTAGVPVVVFTTSTRDADRDSAMAAGANFVVVKPIQFAQMVEFAASLAWRAQLAA